MFKLAEFPPILPTKMQGLDLYSTTEADIYIFNEALVECVFFFFLKWKIDEGKPQSCQTYIYTVWGRGCLAGVYSHRSQEVIIIGGNQAAIQFWLRKKCTRATFLIYRAPDCFLAFPVRKPFTQDTWCLKKKLCWFSFLFSLKISITWFIFYFHIIATVYISF